MVHVTSGEMVLVKVRPSFLSTAPGDEVLQLVHGVASRQQFGLVELSGSAVGQKGIFFVCVAEGRTERRRHNQKATTKKAGTCLKRSGGQGRVTHKPS